MRAYFCPTCGRFLIATDAPAGVKFRVPCDRCARHRRVVTAEAAAPRPPVDKPPRPR